MADPDAKHRARLWIGRVELFFTCAFQDRDGVKGEYDLAFLRFLYDFKCPSAMGAMQHNAGVRLGCASIIRANKTLVHFTGRPSYSGQGAALAGVPWRILCAYHSSLFCQSEAAVLQTRIADQAGDRGVGSKSQIF